MAGRYLITGTQIGIIRGMINANNTQAIVRELNEIYEDQFLGNSDNPVLEDVKKLQVVFR